MFAKWRKNDKTGKKDKIKSNVDANASYNDKIINSRVNYWIYDM